MKFCPPSPSVALVGRQNVGKSSIYNKLTNTRSALVADLPGMTRDYRMGHCPIEKGVLSIIDTGGLSQSAENILNYYVNQKTIEIIKVVNHVILVVDALVGYTHTDETIFNQILKMNIAFSVFINKSENKSANELVYEFSELTKKPFYIVSALQSSSLNIAMNEVVEENNLTPYDNLLNDNKSCKVTFYGKPNVGKSTLLNKLLGYNRVIESESPGTTREDLSVDFEKNNVSYQLTDTAGIRRKNRVSDGAEKISALRTLSIMRKSDIIILILDASEKLSFQDLRLFSNISKSNVPFLIVANKMDKLNKETKAKFSLDIERKITFHNLLPIIYISGKNGKGISQFLAALGKLTRSLKRNLKTNDITQVLINAVTKHPPPMVRGRRSKLRYAHLIKNPNTTILVHGNQVENLPEDYRRYLSNFFRENLGLRNHPLSLVFKSAQNPFAGKKNLLNPRQIKKRRRLIKYTNKKNK